MKIFFFGRVVNKSQRKKEILDVTYMKLYKLIENYKENG